MLQLLEAALVADNQVELDSKAVMNMMAAHLQTVEAGAELVVVVVMLSVLPQELVAQDYRLTVLDLVQ